MNHYQSIIVNYAIADKSIYFVDILSKQILQAVMNMMVYIWVI